MKNLKIVVSGYVGTGKSCVSYIIKEALESKGFTVTLTDDEYDYETAMDKQHVQYLSNAVSIDIETHQEPRTVTIIKDEHDLLSIFENPVKFYPEF